MKIRTVRGDISPNELGVTLPHEHLLVDVSCRRREPQDPYLRVIADRPVDVTILADLRRNPMITKVRSELRTNALILIERRTQPLVARGDDHRDRRSIRLHLDRTRRVQHDTVRPSLEVRLKFTGFAAQFDVGMTRHDEDDHPQRDRAAHLRVSIRHPAGSLQPCYLRKPSSGETERLANFLVMIVPPASETSGPGSRSTPALTRFIQT